MISEKAKQSLSALQLQSASFRPTIFKFLNQHTGLCLYTIIIYVFFFSMGVPILRKFGYSIEFDIHKYNFLLSE